MDDRKAAQRFAQALFDTAQAEKRLQAVAHDVAILMQLLEQSDELAIFVTRFDIPDETRLKVLNEISGDWMNPHTKKFLLFMESEKQLQNLQLVCEFFINLYNSFQGIHTVHVYTAYPLSDHQRTTLYHKLSSRFGPHVEIDVKEDGSLLGGFIIQTGDFVYDYSISGRLRRLKQKLAEA